MNTATNAWLKVLGELLALPKTLNPTVELLNHTMSFDMAHPIVLSLSRKLSYRYMAAESYWTIIGSNRLDHSESVNQTLMKWSADTIYLKGAYGPGFVTQMPYILEIPRDNSASRQAVISIWVPNPRDKNDLPCTLTLQFLVRDNLLHCIVNMRSSDVYLGLPNDMFVFTMMSACVLIESQLANDVGVKLGTCFINAGSRHLYETNRTQAHEIFVLPKVHEEEVAFEPHTHTYKSFMEWLERAATAPTREEAQNIIFGVDHDKTI